MKLMDQMEISPRLVDRRDAEDTGPRTLIAEWLYRSRQERPGVEDTRLFGEPAWDMLLDLYVHQAKGLSTSITGACIGSHAPPTTALRYVELLHDQGWIEKIPDESDRRRSFLALTPTATRRLDRHFDQLLERLAQITPDLFASLSLEKAS
ncbi:hypothetical protein [Novosphingobium sp. JCM 18896]|uniref:hypothetical protein n=1 Tax=Novosphingobium sp. JCM 18896 TaxID=2989731 RepID=UPI002221A8C6|nr:hypothetical protein [Novosphingobium sp. JCM 18896]MCW1429922.1 hypothetical protein [Novosphingobium sp. JCM 18896]